MLNWLADPVTEPDDPSARVGRRSEQRDAFSRLAAAFIGSAADRLRRLPAISKVLHCRALALPTTVAALLCTMPPAVAGLQEVIAAAKPSVVAVGSYNPTDSPRFGFRGSGFVVGDGTLVVTNVHVLP